MKAKPKGKALGGVGWRVARCPHSLDSRPRVASVVATRVAPRRATCLARLERAGSQCDKMLKSKKKSCHIAQCRVLSTYPTAKIDSY